jgi:hypothetical protein
MMECKDVLANLSSYLDGEVSAEFADGIGGTRREMPALPCGFRHY